MNKVLLSCCLALTLVLVVNGAPTVSPPTPLLPFLVQDLQVIQKKLTDVSERMKRYELYIPSNTSSIEDLQCFMKELVPVAQALKYESKAAQDIETAITNINVTVNRLMGPKTAQCHYSNKIKMEGFFKELIEFCQRLIGLTQ